MTMYYDELIKKSKARIGGCEYSIISYEQELGGRGESSIIRCY